MRVYLHTKFQVSIIIRTSFRQEGGSNFILHSTLINTHTHTHTHTHTKNGPLKAHLDQRLWLKISQRWIIVVSFISIEVVIVKVKISKIICTDLSSMKWPFQFCFFSFFFVEPLPPLPPKCSPVVMKCSPQVADENDVLSQPVF